MQVFTVHIAFLSGHNSQRRQKGGVSRSSFSPIVLQQTHCRTEPIIARVQWKDSKVCISLEFSYGVRKIMPNEQVSTSRNFTVKPL